MNKQLTATKEAIKEFRKRKANEIIAEIAENAGLIELAIATNIKLKSFEKAVKLAKKEGLTKRAKEICEKAIQYYKKKDVRNIVFYEKELETLSNPKLLNDEEICINLSSPASRYSRCITYSLNHQFDKKDIERQIEKNDFYNAARMAEQSGFKKLADELYKKGFEDYCKENKYFIAAKIAKRKGWKDKAKEMFEKTAVQLYEKSQGDAGKNDRNRAAELAETEGLTETALFINETLGKFHKAAELAEKLGLQEKAVENYKNALGEYAQKNKFHIAAALADKIGLTERARELYKKSIEWFEKDIAESKEFTEDFFTIINDAFKKIQNKSPEDKKLIKSTDRFIDKIKLGKIRLWK